MRYALCEAHQTQWNNWGRKKGWNVKFSIPALYEAHLASQKRDDTTSTFRLHGHYHYGFILIASLLWWVPLPLWTESTKYLFIQLCQFIFWIPFLCLQALHRTIYLSMSMFYFVVTFIGGKPWDHMINDLHYHYRVGIVIVQWYEPIILNHTFFSTNFHENYCLFFIKRISYRYRRYVQMFMKNYLQLN